MIWLGFRVKKYKELKSEVREILVGESNEGYCTVMTGRLGSSKTRNQFCLVSTRTES